MRSSSWSRRMRTLQGTRAYDHGMRGILATLVTAAAIAPPVIHEPFTALPCPLHPDTTIDVVGCQEHRVLRTDRAIDAQVRAIFRLLRTDAGARRSSAGERSWLQYRRQSCSAEASRSRAAPRTQSRCSAARSSETPRISPTSRRCGGRSPGLDDRVFVARGVRRREPDLGRVAPALAGFGEPDDEMKVVTVDGDDPSARRSTSGSRSRARTSGGTRRTRSP